MNRFVNYIVRSVVSTTTRVLIDRLPFFFLHLLPLVFSLIEGMCNYRATCFASRGREQKQFFPFLHYLERFKNRPQELRETKLVVVVSIQRDSSSSFLYLKNSQKVIYSSSSSSYIAELIKKVRRQQRESIRFLKMLIRLFPCGQPKRGAFFCFYGFEEEEEEGLDIFSTIIYTRRADL